MVKAVQLVAIAALSGLSLRLALGYAGQRWATTYHTTMSYLLLPVIGMAITKTISGNIALSLGMIGALSIVRFRHPVKSPLELVVFFLLLTIGVTLTVDVQLGVLLVAYAVAMVVVVHWVKNAAASRGKDLFAVSFTEGEPMHLLEVTSTVEVESLRTHPHLVMAAWREGTGLYDYRIASRARADLEQLAASVTGGAQTVRVELRLAQ